jgi:hypothetical protein
MALSSITTDASWSQPSGTKAPSPSPEAGKTDIQSDSSRPANRDDRTKDTVTIGSSQENTENETYSPSGLKKGNRDDSMAVSGADEEKKNKGEDASPSRSDQADDTEYTREEQERIVKLQARDREVKAHEQAHIAAGGQYVRGGASFDYETGPDGEKYAVGGEVSIDVSKESGDPGATIAKMQVVIRAALAPANPSSQDRSVAAQATRIESEARMQSTAANAYTGQTSKGQKEETGDKEMSADPSSGKTKTIDRYV